MGGIYVIDRFEGNFAVLENEDGSHINAPKDLISDNAREGDVVEETDSGFTVRVDLTKERRDKILEKQKKLFRHRSEEI